MWSRDQHKERILAIPSVSDVMAALRLLDDAFKARGWPFGPWRDTGGKGGRDSFLEGIVPGKTPTLSVHVTLQYFTIEWYDYTRPQSERRGTLYTIYSREELRSWWRKEIGTSLDKATQV